MEKLKEWDCDERFIAGNLSYKSPINIATGFGNLLPVDGEFTEHVDFYFLIQLFPNCLFGVYRNDDNQSYDYGLKYCSQFTVYWKC